MERAAKQGIGVASAVAGVIAITKYQTIVAIVVGVILVGLGVWLIASD